MYNINNLLEGSTVPDWIVNSFPVIRIILVSLIVLLALSVVVIILCMESNPEGGSNVVTGVSDSFYAQNQSSTREGRLKKLIIIFSIILVVLAILFFVSYLILPLAK